MQIKRSALLVTLPVFAVLLACTLFAAPALCSAQQPYKVIDQWKPGGDGGWDYLTVDPGGHRLYIARGPQIQVVNTQTGKLAGAITGLHGTHGVALDTAGKFGYISDGGGNAVVVFDRVTLATVATIPAGTGPDSILFEPSTQTVWAFNGRSKDATVIDAASQKAGAFGDRSSSPGWKVVATIPLPGKPEAPATDGKGLVYDNIEDKNEIVRLDAHTLKLTAEWPVTGCEGPGGMAADPAGSRIFSSCDGKKMAVVDTKTGKVIATPTIGDGPDAAGWSAKYELALASCGEGVISVIDAASPDYKTIQTLTTQRGARTMAYDPATDRIYTVTAEYGPRPAPTPENPRPRPPVLPGTFTVIVIGR